jgi:hypothetical protein
MARTKLGALLQRKPVARAVDRPDYRDGRDFDPLDISDGRPRLLITETVQEVDGTPTLVYHVDYWNVDLRDQTHVQRLYLRGGGAVVGVTPRAAIASMVPAKGDGA